MAKKNVRWKLWGSLAAVATAIWYFGREKPKPKPKGPAISARPIPPPPATIPPPEANYRTADPSTGQSCGNCRYAQSISVPPPGFTANPEAVVRCTLWQVDVLAGSVCDYWEPRAQRAEFVG